MVMLFSLCKSVDSVALIRISLDAYILYKLSLQNAYIQFFLAIV